MDKIKIEYVFDFIVYISAILGIIFITTFWISYAYKAPKEASKQEIKSMKESCERVKGIVEQCISKGSCNVNVKIGE